MKLMVRMRCHERGGSVRLGIGIWVDVTIGVGGCVLPACDNLTFPVST